MDDETMKAVLTIIAWVLAFGLVAPMYAVLDGDKIVAATKWLARKLKRAFRAA